MRIDGTRRIWSWRRTAAVFLALIAGCSSFVYQTGLSAQARAGGAQSAGDPCRFVTADAVGKAFGRPMQSSKLVDVCQYRGTPNGLVVLRVKEGPEGTILRHTKTAAAQGQKGAEKITTKIGEAYFDSILPAFIGRVGNYDVQLETTIEPVPRDAMIAIGTRVMETLTGK